MKVNKTIYIILALLLGGFGIHKFYAGKNFSGLLHLLFCWTGIPQVLGIISAILTLFKVSDDEGHIEI
ncbi:TM2 domain-containing protein [Mammaliicoccus sciuri]|uniref:TM2 domain-containing protein n=1 Tax=Mammaliicoccus sciuri TaxID=1296 RepID=UPI0034DCD612